MSYSVASPRRPHGGMGIASFAVAIAGFLMSFASLGAGTYLKVTNQATAGLNVLIGLVLFLGWFIDVIAIAFAIVGLFDRESRKTFAVLGLCFALGGGALFAVVTILGLMRLHALGH